MAASASEGTVQVALIKFLKDHNLQDSVGDVDDIVLQYVISILEDLGDSQNAEENIDVDQFIDVMDAYIPGFKDIESVEVCEWMFQLASSLSKTGTESNEPNQAIDRLSTQSLQEDQSGLTASGCGHTRQHLDSQGDSERSTSESSQDDIDEQLQLLMEMFPSTLKLEVEHCFHCSEGDLDRAVQLLLHREGTGTAITEESLNKTKEKKKKKSFLPTQSKEEKEKMIQRYAFIDVDDDKKTHRPPPPKAEPKKLIRYLDGQVVNTKGQKYTEIKQQDDEEMKKTYVNLKPARKYRFH